MTGKSSYGPFGNRGHRGMETIASRLAHARTLLEEGFRQDPDEGKRILKERARILAQRPSPQETGPCLETLEFLLTYERYALESACVKEVYSMRELTPLPCAPSFLLGIANLRGLIIPVIDLKRLFRLPERGITNLNKVIVLNSPDGAIGITADEVLGARMIQLDDIQPIPSTFSGIRAACLKGIAKDGTIVIDMEVILADTSLIVSEETP